LDPIYYFDFPNNIRNYNITLIFIKSPKSESDRILLVSLYRLPEIKFELQDWYNLFQKIVVVGTFETIVVAGDLNAQHPSWRATRSNSAGISLNEY